MKKVAILIANNIEVVEAMGPFDILQRNNNIDVHLISIEKDNLITVTPKGKIEGTHNYNDINIYDYDALVLPGGSGHEAIDNHKDIEKILKHYINKNKLVASICASPSILGKRGYLKNKNAISWEGKIKELIGSNIVDEQVVIDDNIITARDFKASLEFGSAILKYLLKK